MSHRSRSSRARRHLTTQINIAGDPLVHDDFAFATRDDLIPDVVRHDDREEARKRGLEGPHPKRRSKSER